MRASSLAVLVAVLSMAACGNDSEPVVSASPAAAAANAPSAVTPPAAAAPGTDATSAPPGPASSKAAVPPVAGIVLGPDGQPEAGVRVELQRIESPWPDLDARTLETWFTGPDGRFEFLQPRGPHLMVVAKKDGLADAEVTASPLDPEVVVSMTHGFTVEGAVVLPPNRAFDRRVAGCLVVLEPTALSNRRAISTRTDDSGRFVFRNVAAGPARLTARHPKFRPATEPSIAVGSSGGTQLRFSDKPPITLKGRVVSAGASGRGIADAVVRAYPGAWNSRLFLPYEARTDAEGRFELNGLGPGNLQLEVRHSRWSTADRLLSVSDNTEVTVELIGRSEVAGELRGTKLPSGLELEMTQVGEPPVRVVAGDDGRFELPGRYSAGKAELEVLDDHWSFTQSGSRSLAVQIADSGKTDLTLALEPASVLRGAVQDEDGAPIPGVRVLWRESTDGPTAPFRLVAVTDDRGRYEVRGLGRSTSIPGPFALSTFVFHRRGWAVEMQRYASAAPGEVHELDPVTLVRPGTIVGRVTRGGRGIAGAVVLAGKGVITLHSEVSGPDGRFTFHDLSPGTYRLKARHAALPLVVSPEIEVRAGETAGPVIVEMPAGRTIHGHVVNHFGEPVANALVVVRGHRSQAVYGDANGEFTIEVPDDDVQLQVFADLELYQFHVQTTTAVPRDVDDVQVKLDMVATGTVVVRVLGLPDRRPPPGVIVRLRSQDSRDHKFDVGSRWVEATGGKLRIESLPAGPSTLELHAQGFVPQVLDVDVTPRGEVQLPDVLLEPGATVRGIVVDETGKPVPNAWVHLGDPRDRIPADAIPASAFTDAEGRFEVRGASTHSRDLVVSAEGFAIRSHPLQVPQDLLRKDPLRVVLDVGTTIEVKLAGGGDDGGQPALNTVVLARDGDLIDFSYTENDGTVRFAHREVGEYEVSLLGDPATARKVVVEPNGPSTVSVQLDTSVQR